jgi:putative transposase
MPDWPHSPLHRLGEAGAYIVTAGTYNKQLFLHTPSRLSLVRDMLFELARETGWQLQAWAILANHYHFVAQSPEQATTLTILTRKLHACTSRIFNLEDCTPDRKVWFQYWETHLTYERSYYARLNYVHQNPVKHGIIKQAVNYPWCSAGWFARTATPAFYKRITSLPIDKVNVRDLEME